VDEQTDKRRRNASGYVMILVPLRKKRAACSRNASRGFSAVGTSPPASADNCDPLPIIAPFSGLPLSLSLSLSLSLRDVSIVFSNYGELRFHGESATPSRFAKQVAKLENRESRFRLVAVSLGRIDD